MKAEVHAIVTAVNELTRQMSVDADRIETLEAENAELQSKVGTIRLAAKYAAKIRDDRIEKLEAALQWYAEHCQKGGDEIEGPFGDYGQRASKALEGKDD